MGIEPSKVGVKTRGFGVWRYQCYSFFAVSFPFFFLEGNLFHPQNLTGDKTYESKIRSRRIRKGTVQKLKRLTEKPEKCPRCGCKALWKDGHREGPYGTIQRYFCRDCVYRFSTW